MPLAGSHDHVARTGQLYSKGDGLDAIGHPVVARAGALSLSRPATLAPLRDGVDDLVQILRARVLGRNHGYVGHAPRNLAHHAPLQHVALARTAKDHDQPSPCLLAQGRQRLLQRVGRVREIHDRGEILPRLDPFHVAADRAHGVHALIDRLGRQVEGQRGTRGGEDVVHVVALDQPRPDRNLHTWSAHGEGSLPLLDALVARRHVRLRLEGVGHVAIGRDRGQDRIGAVVGIEHRDLGHARLAPGRREVMEKPRLVGAVLLPGAVIVEVRMRDVGHHRHVKIDRGHPVLGQPVRRRLEHDRLRSCRQHLRQQRLDLGRVRGGDVQAGVQRALADQRVHRADHACPEPCRSQDRAHQVDRRRLALCPRHADHDHLAAGMAVPGGGELCQGHAPIRYLHVRHLRRQFLWALPLADDRCRPALDRLRDEAVGVHVLAHIGHKEPPRFHLARVRCQTADLNAGLAAPTWFGLEISKQIVQDHANSIRHGETPLCALENPRLAGAAGKAKTLHLRRGEGFRSSFAMAGIADVPVEPRPSPAS